MDLNETIPFTYFRWTRPGNGISSIDENSVFNGSSRKDNNVYGKLTYEPYPQYATRKSEFCQMQQIENPSSLNYFNNTSPRPNYSPPLSDLNPISLPYLGTAALPKRPVSYCRFLLHHITEGYYAFLIAVRQRASLERNVFGIKQYCTRRNFLIISRYSSIIIISRNLSSSF